MTGNLRIEDVEHGAAEYEHAITETGFGRYNVLLIFICGSSILTVLVETLGMAYIIPSAQCDLNLTISDKSMISSMGFLGIVVSSVFWGFVADSIGRRKVMLLSTIMSSLSGFASSLVTPVWLFIVLRFVNSFFIGCPASVVIAYAGEFHSDKYRAKAISWIGSFVAFSSFYLPTVAWIVLPMQWSFVIPGIDVLMRPWRLLIILFSLPGFLVLFCFFYLSESPKYLWSVGESEKSLAILRKMFKKNTGKDESLYSVTKFEMNAQPEKITYNNSSKSPCSIVARMIKLIWSQIVPIFTMPLLPNMILAATLQFGIQSGAQGVFIWVPEIFNKIAIYMDSFPNQSVMICEAVNYSKNVTNMSQIVNLTHQVEETIICSDILDEEVFKITLILGALSTVLFIIMGFIINIVGKKLLLVIIFIVTAISAFILNFVNSYPLIMTFLCLYLSTGPSINIVLSIQVDMFPTEHRAKAVAISQMMGRLGAMVGSLVTGFLIQFYCGTIFYLFSVVFALLIICAMLLPIPLFVSNKNNT